MPNFSKNDALVLKIAIISRFCHEITNSQEVIFVTVWTRSSKTQSVEIVSVLMGSRTKTELVLTLMSVLTALVEKTR